MDLPTWNWTDVLRMNMASQNWPLEVKFYNVFCCTVFCLFIVNLFYWMIVSTSSCQRQDLQVPLSDIFVIVWTQ